MPDTTGVFLLGLAVGVLAGGVIPAYLQYRRAMREPPKIVLRVDQALVANITEELVMAWLNQRGLVWMPKGLEKVVAGRSR